MAWWLLSPTFVDGRTDCAHAHHHHHHLSFCVDAIPNVCVLDPLLLLILSDPLSSQTDYLIRFIGFIWFIPDKFILVFRMKKQEEDPSGFQKRKKRKKRKGFGGRKAGPPRIFHLPPPASPRRKITLRNGDVANAPRRDAAFAARAHRAARRTRACAGITRLIISTFCCSAASPL